jgi:hypothetical protein
MLPLLRERVYNPFMDDQPKLKIVKSVPPPEKPRASARLKATKVASIPQCPRCSGRTYLTIQTADTKQKACFFCSMKGEMVVMV